MAHLTGLNLIHLDQYFFLPNWEEKNRDEWIRINKELIAKEGWIIDGNYSSTLDMIMKAADTMIYLDSSTLTSLYRVISRIIQYHGKRRPDVAEGCNERWDWHFIHYVLTFNFIKKPSILNKMNSYSQEKQIVILSNENERNGFLKKTVPLK